MRRSRSRRPRTSSPPSSATPAPRSLPPPLPVVVEGYEIRVWDLGVGALGFDGGQGLRGLGLPAADQPACLRAVIVM